MQHFVCIGHAKCGTTLLDSVFRQSRLMGTPAETKEIKFFLPRFFPQEAAHERYLEKFVTADGQRPAAATFEASPQYSHQPEEILRAVLENIKRTLPHARIVICFRHPVLRAYSHYIHNLHTFALYGEGVFSPRADLLRKPCRISFEEALAGTSRLQVNYATTLRLAYEVMGRESVALFFLEEDGKRLGDWSRRHIGQQVSDEVAPIAERVGAVFVRRPVPNYLISEGVLHAFGSQPGEYVRYEDGDHDRLQLVLRARDRWTLELLGQESARLARDYFQADMRACATLSDDENFLNYLSCFPNDQFAEVTSLETLCTLHDINVPPYVRP
ncbi:sulfotransferase family protein [Pseudoxanthomonas sp. 3HH-4]|uniref:sulfotransferase n=1 Tax=Pseudoxanthomonas sp. 3HH-4 TaxID=1690214 RepID=UPI0011543A62|nr:sulfotransferase [Pseudoxanthomonas sp. 3HH-4]TQM17413.1 sulfotransferase family protein [Pseudoxanthomonas sp. 3HH-4]